MPTRKTPGPSYEICLRQPHALHSFLLPSGLRGQETPAWVLSWCNTDAFDASFTGRPLIALSSRTGIDRKAKGRMLIVRQAVCERPLFAHSRHPMGSASIACNPPFLRRSTPGAECQALTASLALAAPFVDAATLGGARALSRGRPFDRGDRIGESVLGAHSCADCGGAFAHSVVAQRRPDRRGQRIGGQRAVRQRRRG